MTEDEILNKYHDQFIGYFDQSAIRAPIAYGLEIAEEWYPYVEGVCAKCEELQIPVCWTQVKEKFGELRMYYDARPGAYAELGEDKVNELFDKLDDIILNAAREIDKLRKRR